MMRKVIKGTEPSELRSMRMYWERKVREVGSAYYKTKYRMPPIKQALLKETFSKCVYCESKVGHNTPGDVEHKTPVSHHEAGRFDWMNLTIACTECNRRKNDYFDAMHRFIDPYSDDVEAVLVHVGPYVMPSPGNDNAEIAVRILDLGSIEKRRQLFGQKSAILRMADQLMQRIQRQHPGPLKNLLLKELVEMATPGAEYSGMVLQLLRQVPGPWNAEVKLLQSENLEKASPRGGPVC